MATVSGTTKDTTGALASKLVRVYKRSTGAFVGAALSNTTTGAWSVTTTDTSEHFAVMHDSTGDPMLDKVVVGLPFTSSLADTAGHTFAAAGGATISSARSAYGSNSLSLNGTTQYLSCTSVDFDMGSSDFTIEAFVYTDLTLSRTILGKQYSYDTSRSYKLEFFTSGGVMFTTDVAGTGTGNLKIIAADGSLTANTWTHIAVERQGSYFKLYVGGALKVTSAAAPGAVFTNTEPLLIGSAKYLGSPSYLFNGYINGVRITKGAARYGGAFTPPTTPYPIAPSGGVNALVFDAITPV